MNNADPVTVRGFVLSAAFSRLFKCKVIGDGICEGSRLHTGPRVHDHSGRFINDGERLVLKENFEGNVLRLKDSYWLLNKVDLDLITSAYLIGGLSCAVVDEDVLVID